MAELPKGAVITSAIVWLDSPMGGRVGIDVERREFVLEVGGGKKATLPLAVAQQLVALGNEAAGTSDRGAEGGDRGVQRGLGSRRGGVVGTQEQG